MKNKISILTAFIFAALLFNSCKKESEDEDEGLLPLLSFKTGDGYTSGDSTYVLSHDFKIGIKAQKAEPADVLIRFNISKSINSGEAISFYQQNLSGASGDLFYYDYDFNAEPFAGQVTTYIFSVTNRDGLTKKISLSVTSVE